MDDEEHPDDADPPGAELQDSSLLVNKQRSAPVGTSSIRAKKEFSFARAGVSSTRTGDVITNETVARQVDAPPQPDSHADPPSAQPVEPLLPPAAICDSVIKAGAKKAALRPMKLFLLSVISGCHIGFGSCCALILGGDLPSIKEDDPGLQKLVFGAFGLPLGLMMTVVTGAELFTSSTAFVATAVMARKATVGDLVRNWTITYLGNFVGSLIIACLFSAAGVVPVSAAHIAQKKVSESFVQAFSRAILANWLVCMATWMAAGANDLASKMVAIWFPISSFVAMGLEHSIANMSIIPAGMFLNDHLETPITVADFLVKNLIPVTLGNAVAGVFAVAAPYMIAFKHL